MSAIRRSRPGGSYLTPSYEHATVADAMHPGVMSCSPDATVVEVARMMATHHVHCVTMMGVSQGTAGESLVWCIVTDADLIEAATARGLDQTAQSVATQPIISVEPTMALTEAAALMRDHHASHVLVVDSPGQHPVGVLSTLDVVGLLAWGEG